MTTTPFLQDASQNTLFTEDSRLIDYGSDIEGAIAALAGQIEQHQALVQKATPRWLAIKLLENDPHIISRVQKTPETGPLLEAAATLTRHLSQNGEDTDIQIGDARYRFINTLVNEVTTRPVGRAETLSDRADRVLTHPLWGMPVFIVAIWLVFTVTVNISTYFVNWIDYVINEVFAGWLIALLGWVNLGGSWFESLLVDGILGGVGSVLVFVPVLMFMYFFIAILEDSGYMARAAFLMDRFMHMIGLHGKSFIPLLLGFGCSVPGIYATRTLETRRDRLLTGMLVPFMSCGARLPVFLLIGTAFFGRRAGLLVFALYLLGIVTAIVVGFILQKTVLRSTGPLPFLIELPPYRMPDLKGLLLHTWLRTKGFLEGAASVILIAALVVWLLVSIPVSAPPGSAFAKVDTDNSALAALSRWMAPALKPAGFGDWEAAASLTTGFIAKEVIISTLGIVYSGSSEADTGPESLSFGEGLLSIIRGFARATWDAIREIPGMIPGIRQADAQSGTEPGNPALASALNDAFSPLSATAFCVFVLLMSPCVSALAAMRQEFGVRWMAISTGMMLAIAWLGAVIVYQGGRILGFG